MSKKLILLLALSLVLGNASSGYTAEAEVTTTTATVVPIITLEQARGLAIENSRTLQKHESNVKKTKYQQQQAEYQLNEAIDRYNSIGSKLDEDNYSNSILDQLDSQSEKIESASDSIDNAEDSYNDAVKEENNYQKQLGYLVEEFYTTILNQEADLAKLNKEYELKEYFLNVERKKLGLGSSSQYKVDELVAGVKQLNKNIIEQTNNIKTKKGQLNDMMGRGYDEELQLASFEVPVTLEIPEYERLLSDVTYSYTRLSQLKRDLNNSKEDYKDEDDYYKSLILSQEIKAKELELVDETNGLYEKVNNMLTDAKSKQENYQLILTNFRNAQRSYEWDKKRYELGQISKQAFLESELSFLNMQNQKISAAYALYLAQGSLKLAAEGIVMN
ncbi:TolC family protein [Desulforamulus aeronauticus]|uniref:Outer membrane protein TolC n=1 Tax=Desulforamulus aeronauticus DSM 10349 TaxID=1121421 RepID=A0A1M6S5M1_9FIRM|nr:TolC family protein [Desulforamulus aeronauticus]SHK39807.1 Outer membrane protein TolC [Desulforamulus aeronauticus DSM 10349]